VAVSCGIGCIISTSVLDKIGTKISLALGAISSSFWIAGNVFAAWKHQGPTSDSFVYSEWFVYSLLLILAAFNGITLAFLWVAQGNYISECATEATRGFYFSYFWAYY
jgi:MFS family permease